MLEFQVGLEMGCCVHCGQRLRVGERYYDIDGTWVHKKCWIEFSGIQNPRLEEPFETTMYFVRQARLRRKRER